MPSLPLETANIYYEISPSTPNPTAPVLLLIHGGNGTCNGFRRLAALLAPSMTVIIYDRRGFSRSALTGPQDYTGTARIERDAADAAALITHLSPRGKAVVLGNSSGAMVALEVLVRHPEAVEVLFAHEPPAMAHLEGREEWFAKQKVVYDLYREKGHVAAMGVFAEMVRAKDDSGWATGAAARMEKDREDPYFHGNIIYWMEREVMQTVFHEFDLDRMQGFKGKLVLVNGKGTSPEAPQYLGNVALAKDVGLEVTMFEGGHLAWQADPERFAEDLKTALKGRGALYSEL